MELSILGLWLLALEHKVIFMSESRKKERKAKKKKNQGDKVTL